MNDRLAEHMARVYGPTGAAHDAQREQLLAALPDSQPEQTHALRRRMRRLLIGESTMTRPRILVRLAAAAAVVGLLILAGFLLTRAATPQVAFADVLQNMRELRALHGVMGHNGRRTEFWAAAPDRLRIEHADGTYEISHGPDLWVVDPKANRATRKPSHYHREAAAQGVDVVTLMTGPLFNEVLSGFVGQEPSEQIQRDGRTMDVYRLSWEQNGRQMQGEVMVDVTAGMLDSFDITVEGDTPQHVKFTMSDYNQPISDERLTFTPAPGMQVAEQSGRDKAPQQAETAASGGSTLSGRIVWAETGKPVAGARVSVFAQRPGAAGSRPERDTFRATTDRDGRWTVTGIAAGSVQFSVRSWEFNWPSVPRFKENRGSNKQPAMMVDGTRTYDGLDFGVYKPEDWYARVLIRVTDENGKPVDHARANLGDGTAVYAGHGKQYCGPDGLFDDRSIWPTQKPFRLHVGGRAADNPFVSRGVQSEPFVVEAKGEYSFDMVLPFARTIDLTVTDRAGDPLEGVIVSALTTVEPHAGSMVVRPSLTDADGRVAITGLLADEPIIVALKQPMDEDANPSKGLVAAKASAYVAMVAPSGREPVAEEATFDTRPVRVTGTVELGFEAERVSIWVVPPGLGGRLVSPVLLADVDDDGSFAVDGLPAGDAGLTIRCRTPEGDRRFGLTLHAESGHTYEVRLTPDEVEILNDTP